VCIAGLLLPARRRQLLREARQAHPCIGPAAQLWHQQLNKALVQALPEGGRKGAGQPNRHTTRKQHTLLPQALLDARSRQGQ
jgi:hypothetical protein